jgi:hypothetical protein
MSDEKKEEKVGLTEDQARQVALELYTGPFTFQHGYIYDAVGNMVADNEGQDVAARIRGWGRISYLGDDTETIQDMVGTLFAEALTKFWDAEGNHWKDWKGGENPIPGRRVEFYRRDGDKVVYDNSNDCRWAHRDSASDIVRYRPLS